jgi:hypothetical protein
VNISEEHVASVFRVKENTKKETVLHAGCFLGLFFDHKDGGRHILPKRLLIFKGTTQHYITQDSTIEQFDVHSIYNDFKTVARGSSRFRVTSLRDHPDFSRVLDCKVKRKVIPVQAVEALRVVRG